MKKIFIPTALFFLFLSGCASSGSQTELTFSFSASKGEATKTKTVSCPEDISCEMFLAVPKSAWQPVEPNTPCTRIWGGPETMRVEGTIEGETIDSSFSLSGGCEIDRWEEAYPLFRAVFGDDLNERDYAPSRL